MLPIPSRVPILLIWHTEQLLLTLVTILAHTSLLTIMSDVLKLNAAQKQKTCSLKKGPGSFQDGILAMVSVHGQVLRWAIVNLYQDILLFIQVTTKVSLLS